MLVPRKGSIQTPSALSVEGLSVRRSTHKHMMKGVLVVMVALGLSVASAVPSETDGLLSTALHFVKECGDKSMFLCMKVGFV